MVDSGYLKLLIDFDIAEDYWTHMLKDFPGHPAGASATTSIPLTLYGHLSDAYIIKVWVYLLANNTGSYIAFKKHLPSQVMRDKLLGTAICLFTSNRICHLGYRMLE